MNVFSRRHWIGVWLLLFLISACNLPAQTPLTPAGTIMPAEQTAPTVDTVTPTLVIPVTGMEELASVQCQFCINDEARAVVVLPEEATFLVSEPIIGVSCLTAQVVNGNRVVFCRGAPQSSFTLSACLDNSNCSQSRITFETCPSIPQTGMNTPQAIFTATSAPVQIPTQVMTLTALATPTVAPDTQATATLPATSTIVPTVATSATPRGRAPGTGLHDPAGFIRWYFDAVWRSRNYQDLWDHYLTASYKANVGSGLFEDYVGWWESVERVEVHAVDVLQNDGTQAWVRVTATFHMRDGRVVANQVYEYNLLYDPNRATWMFDF